MGKIDTGKGFFYLPPPVTGLHLKQWAHCLCVSACVLCLLLLLCKNVENECTHTLSPAQRQWTPTSRLNGIAHCRVWTYCVVDHLVILPVIRRSICQILVLGYLDTQALRTNQPPSNLYGLRGHRDRQGQLLDIRVVATIHSVMLETWTSDKKVKRIILKLLIIKNVSFFMLFTSIFLCCKMFSIAVYESKKYYEYYK